ncbi:MAG: 4-hydroxy-tetrahydrodipicolinate reductase [bacterium]|nr:4-hydroxy-tetrahydrodipicolinate reductase [bacterium]
MPIKVVVSGTGRMGQEVMKAVANEPDLTPAGVLVGHVNLELKLPGRWNHAPWWEDPVRMLNERHTDVVVDFTSAERTTVLARACLDAGVRLVSGTTGLTYGFIEEFGQECRERGLGAVLASNFAIGAVLMIHMAKIASRYFDFAEIIEMHHEKKADAPSGTALVTALAMVAGRGQPFQYPTNTKETLPGTRGGVLDGVSIHSVRLPGLVAHQEVILGTLGQTLTIRHDSTSRESFMPGVLIAVREVMNRKELVVGLDRLIGLA